MCQVFEPRREWTSARERKSFYGITRAPSAIVQAAKELGSRKDKPGTLVNQLTGECIRNSQNFGQRENETGESPKYLQGTLYINNI